MSTSNRAMPAQHAMVLPNVPGVCGSSAYVPYAASITHLLACVLAESQVGFALLDQHLCYQVVSDVFAAGCVKRAADLPGNPVSQATPELAASLVPAASRVLAGDGIQEHTAMPNGRHVQLRLLPWQPAPEAELHVLCVLRLCAGSPQPAAYDREYMLSKALEAAANGVAITSVDGTIEWVNPAFTRLTGYAAHEVIGANPRVLKSNLQRVEQYENLWNTVLNGRVWQGQLVNRRKDGRLYHEEMSITPVSADGERITHFIAIKQDISARIERERERAALLTMSKALRTARTRAMMLPTLLKQASVLLQSEGALLAMRDRTSGETVFELGVGACAGFTGLQWPPGVSVSGRVITSGVPYASNDIQHDPEFAHPELLGEMQAALCMPLRAHDTIIGALWVTRREPFQGSDMHLLAAIADMAANAIQRSTLHEQTEQRLRRLSALRAIDQAITASFDVRYSLTVVIEQVLQQLGVSAADVLILNVQAGILECAAAQGFRTQACKSNRLPLGHGCAGRVALERRRIQHADAAPMVPDRPPFWQPEGFRTYFGTPLIARGQVKGVLEVFHRGPLEPDSDWIDFLETLAGQAAIAIDNAELFGNLQRSHAELALAYDTTLEGWSRALDLRDHETEGHTRRVTAMTVRLARVIGMAESEMVHLRRGALLHDIGKMGIPDRILLKNGPLTNEEWDIMRLHPVYAYELLAPIAYLRQSLDIPYAHHERWDGSGYPRALRGEQIPLAARIFAVVDVWDALLSDRPYRAGWPLEKVRDYIRQQSGILFDPQIVEAFLGLDVD